MGKTGAEREQDGIKYNYTLVALSFALPLFSILWVLQFS